MDKKEIVWSARANNDIGKIWDHVAANFSAQKAIDVTHEIYIQISKLANFPRSGAISKFFPEIREIVIDGNVVFYRIVDVAVIITAIRPRKTRNLKHIK